MLPLAVLVIATLIARAIGWLTDSGLDQWPLSVAIGLAAMFLLTASAHFTRPRRRLMIEMVPPRIGRHAATIVTVTGLLEIAGAIGILIPLTSRLAAICLAVLLIAMFPANVHESRTQNGIHSMPLPARTLVQAVFIAACVFVAVAGI